MRGDTHLITELRDSFGRSAGYTYAKNGAMQQTVSTGYGDDGRISTAGFVHGGEMKQFSYTYLAGSNLLQVLNKPSGMTLTQSYETTRDLLTGIAYHRGSTLVAQRTYSYDTLGRPTARHTARQGSVVNDTFTHNTRSELVSTTVNGTNHEYAYDNIGNRTSSTEGEEVTGYVSNGLNQYTMIRRSAEDFFLPEFDEDGNQLYNQTETGDWELNYNAANRPTDFSCMDEEGNFLTVKCDYDSMGRRVFKKVIRGNSTVISHQRFIYRGYLQIACVDLTRTNHPCLWLITWDPTQPVATRPLAIQKDGTWRTYGLDLTKNVCEVFGSNGYIRTAYTYSPYGQVTANGNVIQPIQWSSEFYDSELGLVYYNWRYFNSAIENWTQRDFQQITNYNIYTYIRNRYVNMFDYLGLFGIPSEFYEYKEEHKVKVGVEIEWWNDNGGPSGGEGSPNIGFYDYQVSPSMKAAVFATCFCGKLVFYADNLMDDSYEKSGFFSRDTIRINLHREMKGPALAYVYFSSSTENHSHFSSAAKTAVASTIGAAIGAKVGSVIPFAGTIIGAATGALIGAFVSDYVSTAIDGGILDKVTEPSFESAPKEEGVNLWGTTVAIWCPIKNKSDKPTIIWGKIVPQKIWQRITANRLYNEGYEYYVPLDRTKRYPLY